MGNGANGRVGCGGGGDINAWDAGPGMCTGGESCRWKLAELLDAPDPGSGPGVDWG